MEYENIVKLAEEKYPINPEWNDHSKSISANRKAGFIDGYQEAFKSKPLDDGQEGKGQAEDYLKASVGKVLNIDFSKEQWYIDWWMLLDPQPSLRCIIRAMEAYKAALPVDDGQEGKETILDALQELDGSIKPVGQDKKILDTYVSRPALLPSAVTGGVKDECKLLETIIIRLETMSNDDTRLLNTIIEDCKKYLMYDTLNSK